MGKVATRTTAPTRTAPSGGPNWPRTIRRLVAAAIGSVFVAALAYERDKWLPPLLDHWLPDAYARVRGQPLAIQIGAAVFVLDMLLAAAIFVIRDQILRVREAAEASRDEDERQQRNMAAGAAQAFAPPAAAITAQGREIADKVDTVQRTADKGVEQGEATLVLVRAMDRKLTAAAPPIPATVAAPGGLPRPATLLGRDDTLAALMRDLRDHDAPIGVFALHGMGGIGKTALAAEAVARLSADRTAFPGGAAWISCESLHGADGLAELWSRVARALGLHEIAALPDAATRRAALASALATRPRTLLALDNVEPALDAYAALDTLAAAGRIALLLTARQPVAPDRLRAVELPPLPDPDAVHLFTQRLTQADPSRPTAGDLPHIPALAAAVGALPLALEQLAAYAGAQQRPLAALAADLARDGINAAAFRANPQRTLAATFDRSWDVLLPRQRRLFAGLSLLAGASLPRAAALALAPATVATTEGETADPDPDADTAALVTYALVEPLANERLRLHPLLREYAAAKLRDLGPAVASPLGDALLAYWISDARAHPGFDGMDALEAEAPGLIGAIAWAHEHQRYHEVLSIAHALNRFWFVRGRIDEARFARPLALEAATRLKDMDEQQWAEHELAVLNAGQGLLAEARAGYERALALARQLGDPAAERDETHALAGLEHNAGNLDEAQAGYEQALALARRLGDPSSEALELRNIGRLVGLDRGRIAEGRQLIDQSRAIYERLGDVYEIGRCHQQLAWLDERERKHDEVIAHYREALRRFEQVQSPDAEDVRAALRELGAAP